CTAGALGRAVVDIAAGTEVDGALDCAAVEDAADGADHLDLAVDHGIGLAGRGIGARAPVQQIKADGPAAVNRAHVLDAAAVQQLDADAGDRVDDAAVDDR